MFTTTPVKDFDFPIVVHFGGLRQSITTANDANFASVIFLTLNKEDAAIPFKERVDSACHHEGINPRDMHHSFSRHQVYYRAVSLGSETTVEELVETVKEMFRATGYKTQILYTDLKELYEKLTEGNKEHG